MLRALNTAALGMNSQQQKVDNISNNLANANTTGYKQSRLVFHDLLYENKPTPGSGEGEGAAAPAMLQIGHGTTAVATVRDFQQGSLEKTGNVFDIAIQGPGFFQIQRPGGEVGYSRDGSFTINAEGNLVTQTGLPMEPPVNIPPDATNVSISQDGIVNARFPGEPSAVEIGQIEIVRFPNPAGLEPQGENLFAQSEASGEPFIGTPGLDGLGLVRQGFLEGANVNVVQEMVNLIQAQRAYEVNSKMVTTTEDMLQIANNLKR